MGAPAIPADFAQRRGAARLAAVQALYQMEIGGGGVKDVVREFTAHRLTEEIEAGAVDVDFFEELTGGVVTMQGDIDPAISGVLASGWKLERLDATARAILRAGTWEILKRPDIPVDVTIAEYLTLADAFFEGPEPKFIHGALDALGRAAPTSA